MNRASDQAWGERSVVARSHAHIDLDSFFHVESTATNLLDNQFRCHVDPNLRLEDGEYIVAFTPLIQPHAPDGRSMVHHINVLLCGEQIFDYPGIGPPATDAAALHY